LPASTSSSYGVIAPAISWPFWMICAPGGSDTSLTRASSSVTASAWLSRVSLPGPGTTNFAVASW